MMVITITSNPKSKWPALCHILSSLCYGPVCFASEDMKEKLTDTQRVIGVSECLALIEILISYIYIYIYIYKDLRCLGMFHVLFILHI